MRKILFMGTGPFALETLEGLYEGRGEDKIFVYTKEAKKAGRGMKEKDGVVAAFAKEKKLPLFQPASLKDAAVQEEMRLLSPDLAVVASYGLILPPAVLEIPRYGCVNIHASLLPKYRGASPINRALMNGDKVTGVTIQKMDAGLDTGDILLSRTREIKDEENAGDLFAALAKMGREMILSLLPDIFENRLSPVSQDESLASYAAKIEKEDQKIDFCQSTDHILCQIRGLSPVPSAFCRMEKDGKILKIHAARKGEGSFPGKAGEVVAVKPDVLVKTGDGVILLDLVQPEGKSKMTGRDAANGRKLEAGDLLL